MTSFVWSVDDAGSGGAAMVESFEKTCRFFESREIRATWFVVPKPGGNPLSDEWKRAFLAARDAGHDLQLHGLTHEDCFEFGPPAWPATAILPVFLTEFERRRDELMARYVVENLKSRIVAGLEVFERELGVVPTVFRAPCGAISKPLFAALAELGIRFESCMYVSGVGYEHLPHRSGSLEPVWVDTMPHGPFHWYSGVIQVPILNEYTWRGASAREEDFKRLAVSDAQRIAKESDVATLLMHTFGIADNYDYSWRLVDTVLDEVARIGGRFATLGALAANGTLERVAEPSGPDLLAV